MDTRSACVTYASALLHTVASLFLPQSILEADRVYYHQTETDQSVSELLSTELIYFTSSFILISLIDYCVVRPVTHQCLRKQKVSTESSLKTAWFLLHTLINLAVTAVTIEEAVLAVVFPVKAAFEPSNWRGTHPGGILAGNIICAFHFHHLVCYYSQCTLADVVHHTMAFTIDFLGLFVSSGRIKSISTFSLCGLSGGLHYFALWLARCNMVGQLTQKQVNRVTSLVIRYPVQLLAIYSTVVSNFHGGSVPYFSPVEYSFGIIILTLGLINAIYFCDQVVGSYHVMVHQKRKE